MSAANMLQQFFTHEGVAVRPAAAHKEAVTGSGGTVASGLYQFKCIKVSEFGTAPKCFWKMELDLDGSTRNTEAFNDPNAPDSKFPSLDRGKVMSFLQSVHRVTNGVVDAQNVYEWAMGNADVQAWLAGQPADRMVPNLLALCVGGVGHGEWRRGFTYSKEGETKQKGVLTNTLTREQFDGLVAAGTVVPDYHEWADHQAARGQSEQGAQVAPTAPPVAMPAVPAVPGVPAAPAAPAAPTAPVAPAGPAVAVAAPAAAPPAPPAVAGIAPPSFL